MASKCFPKALKLSLEHFTISVFVLIILFENFSFQLVQTSEKLSKAFFQKLVKIGPMQNVKKHRFSTIFSIVCPKQKDSFLDVSRHSRPSDSFKLYYTLTKYTKSENLHLFSGLQDSVP